MKHILIFISCLSLSGPLLAEESLEMEGTRIRGNQELPKVLYIVPWKRSEIPDLSQPPLESLIDEALAPVDREVFQRKIRYYDSLSTQEVGSNEN
ncbi:MAG: hypothetical protein PVF28_00760 [Thioalkalispiraceae bacterium]